MLLKKKKKKNEDNIIQMNVLGLGKIMNMAITIKKYTFCYEPIIFFMP